MSTILGTNEILSQLFFYPNLNRLIFSFLPSRDAFSVMYSNHSLLKCVPQELVELELPLHVLYASCHRIFKSLKNLKITEGQISGRFVLRDCCFPVLRMVSLKNLRVNGVQIESSLDELIVCNESGVAFPIDTPPSVQKLDATIEARDVQRLLSSQPHLQEVNLKVVQQDMDQKYEFIFDQKPLKILHFSGTEQQTVRIHSLEYMEYLDVDQAESVFVNYHAEKSSLRWLYIPKFTLSLSKVVGRTEFPQLNLLCVSSFPSKCALNIYQSCKSRDPTQISPYRARRRTTINAHINIVYCSHVSNLKTFLVQSFCLVFVEQIPDMSYLNLFEPSGKWTISPGIKTLDRILISSMSSVDLSRRNLFDGFNGTTFKDMFIHTTLDNWNEIQSFMPRQVENLNLLIEVVTENIPVVEVKNFPTLSTLCVKPTANSKPFKLELSNLPILGIQTVVEHINMFDDSILFKTADLMNEKNIEKEMNGL